MKVMRKWPFFDVTLFSLIINKLKGCYNVTKKVPYIAYKIFKNGPFNFFFQKNEEKIHFKSAFFLFFPRIK